MLGGEEYSNDLSQWLTYKPTDPAGNLVASWHSYSFNTCAALSCWTSQVAPVIAQVPVVVGEMGESDCGGSYMNTLTSWLATQGTGYLAWTWDPDPADSCYVVDYAYLLRESDGSTRVEWDRHVEGLFARADWLRLLADAGFQTAVVPLEHSEVEPGQHEVFVCRRPD